MGHPVIAAARLAVAALLGGAEAGTGAAASLDDCESLARMREHWRIDDADSFNLDSRFSAQGIALPGGETTSVRIDLHRMVTNTGSRMDVSKIGRLVLFLGTGKTERVLFLDDIRLDVVRGGLRNNVHFGRIPGATPTTLARTLLQDPQVRPLVPILKAIPPKRLAIISHSGAMTAHAANSGSFFDVAAEAVCLVNPGVEYKGFHRGMMSVSIARGKYLRAALEYKPTDTFILLFPTSWGEERDMMLEILRTGSNVCRFDSVLPWSNYSPKLLGHYRDFAGEHDGASFVELVLRGWGRRSPAGRFHEMIT